VFIPPKAQSQRKNKTITKRPAREKKLRLQNHKIIPFLESLLYGGISPSDFLPSLRVAV